MAAFMFDVAGLSANVVLSETGPRLRVSGTVVQFRDNADVAFVNASGLDATALEHFVTLNQLNAISVGISWKESCIVCSTINVNVASAPAAIDGVAMNAGDRVALRAQGTVAENGLWEFVNVAAAMVRPADWATGTNQSGSAFVIREGTCADEAYLASADPAVVDTDNPLLLLFATVTAGVTSLALDGAATGVDIITAGPTGAVLLAGLIGQAGVLTAAVVGSDVVYSVVAGGIGTTQLADNGVTEAKLAAGVMLVRRAAVTFSDLGSTVNIGAVVSVGEAMEARFVVDTAFDGVAPLAEIGHAGATSQLMTNAQIDLTLVGVYIVDIDETLVAAAQYQANMTGGVGASTGAGVAMFSFRLG